MESLPQRPPLENATPKRKDISEDCRSPTLSSQRGHNASSWARDRTSYHRHGAQGDRGPLTTTIDSDGELQNRHSRLHVDVNVDAAVIDRPPSSTQPSPEGARLTRPPRQASALGWASFRLGAASHRNEEMHRRDAIDPSIDVARRFRDLHRLRLRIQSLRVRTRDERKRMASTRQRLHRASFELVLAMRQPMLVGLVDDDDTIEHSRHLHGLVQEMDAQELVYDSLESDLIPAEWKLKELEDSFYRHVLRPSAIRPGGDDGDGDSDNGGTAGTSDDPFSPLASPPAAATPPLVVRHQPAESVPNAHEVTRQLRDLEADHEAILEDARARATVGVQIDNYSQQLLQSYPQRRERLLNQLSTLAAPSPAADVLFQVNQFVDADLDVAMRLPGPTGDDHEVLDLHAQDFQVRSDDMVSFLAQPFPESPSGTDATEARPGPTTFRLAPALLKVNDQVPHTMSNIVSLWLLRCVQSSWWSLLRFAFQAYLDEESSFRKLESFFEHILLGSQSSVYELGHSDDPESVGTRQLPANLDVPDPTVPREGGRMSTPWTPESPGSHPTSDDTRSTLWQLGPRPDLPS